MPIITLTFAIHEVNTILQALGALPFNVSAELIERIKKDAQAEVEKAQAAPVVEHSEEDTAE